MPMWQCPHCGTPQHEASRCWQCGRSSTTCSTCRHFRRSLAAKVGYCGLDRRRLPLNGDEHRGCWEAALPKPAPGSRSLPLLPTPMPTPDAPNGFVPVIPGPAGGPLPEKLEPWLERPTLFGEVDR